MSAGDETPEALYVEIGRTLTSWERVEETLSDIFAFFTGAKPGPVWKCSAAKRSYGKIISFAARANVLLEAGAVYFDRRRALYPDFSPTEPDLHRFIHRCSKQAAKRNEVAHGVVRQIIEIEELWNLVEAQWKGMPDFEDKAARMMTYIKPYYLVPASYNSNKTGISSIISPSPGASLGRMKNLMNQFISEGPGSYRYSSGDVASITRTIEQLKVDADLMLLGLIAQREVPDSPTSPETPRLQ